MPPTCKCSHAKHQRWQGALQPSKKVSAFSEHWNLKRHDVVNDIFQSETTEFWPEQCRFFFIEVTMHGCGRLRRRSTRGGKTTFLHAAIIAKAVIAGDSHSDPSVARERPLRAPRPPPPQGRLRRRRPLFPSPPASLPEVRTSGGPSFLAAVFLGFSPFIFLSSIIIWARF